MPIHEWTVFDSFERIARTQPSSPSLVCGGEVFDFQQIHERVCALAGVFMNFGWTKGDTIAIHADNCHRYMEVLLACARLGVILVPISTRLRDSEIEDILKDAQPRGVLVDRVDRSPLWNVDNKWPLITFEGSPPASSLGYEALLDGTHGPDETQHAVAGNDPLTLIYTAAVNGRSQAAILTHRNFVAQMLQTSLAYKLDDRDVHGSFLPLYHTIGLCMSLIASLVGLKNVIIERFDGDRALDAVIEGGVTYFTEFAPMAKMILDAAKKRNVSLDGRIRFVLGLDTSETITEYLRSGSEWYGVYGQTELCGIIATGAITAPDSQQALAGSPMMLSKISIRGESQQPMSWGEVGEICVKGPTCFQGYFRMLSPDRWTHDGWLRTGDLGCFENDRQLKFVGRTETKELIKPGGENVYPAEVEKVLNSHPNVIRSCVFGIPDAKWRERVMAVIELRPESVGADHTADEITAYCKDKIAAYKCPSVIEIATSLPMVGGVVDRRTIKERYGRHHV